MILELNYHARNLLLKYDVFYFEIRILDCVKI